MQRAALLVWILTASLSGQFRDKVGVELDGVGDGTRAQVFVDHAKIHRPCTVINGSDRVAADSDGWPVRDAQCVLFDIRPIPAWAPPIDDPAQYQPDWSGVWSISFEGRADVTVPSGGAVLNLSHDPGTNLTSGTLTVNRGTGLLILAFRNTRREAGSTAESGFRKLRLIRPGYPAKSSQIFTDAFLESLRPFRILRYMDFTETNSVTPSANPPDLLEWWDRHVLSDATQQPVGRKVGLAWEYAVLLANQTGTDMWINIPVSASDGYIRELAALIGQRLDPALRIYVEHGNEVWNRLFANSYNYNRNAAAAEAAQPGSVLNSDNIPLTSVDAFALRRHLKRTVDAARAFAPYRAPRGQTTDRDAWRVRGVFSWWTIQPNSYRPTLAWGKSALGEGGLDQWLYSLANTHYYNVERATVNATPEQLLDVMRASSDAGVGFDNQFRSIAAEFGLRHTIYEGGPDVGGGSTLNVGNRILVNRLDGIKDLVRHDMKTNWFDRGGSEYMYFSHIGPCSRFGCWGAAEDVANLETPKMAALKELTAGGPVMQVAGIVNAGSFESGLAPGSFATIFGSNLADLPFTWNQAIVDGKVLPAMLGGVIVKVGGRSAAVSFAGPSQVNFIVPPGLPPGSAPVEIGSRNGVWRGVLTLQAAAPGLFGDRRNGRFYPAALFAGTATYVAGEGTLAGSASRPAKAGDVIELYATGLGPTSPEVPANEALTSAFPVADRSGLQVSIGGRTAEVLFAGVTFAGVYQVNVRVPGGLDPGERSLTLRVGAGSAQEAWIAIGN
jgi:uncharacterized protein (TIGR03437 family)